MASSLSPLQFTWADFCLTEKAPGPSFDPGYHHGFGAVSSVGDYLPARQGMSPSGCACDLPPGTVCFSLLLHLTFLLQHGSLGSGIPSSREAGMATK